MLIIDDLLFLPVKGLRWVLEQVQSVAEREMLDEKPLIEAIVANEMALEEGRVDRAEYERLQEELLVRLREVRELKKAMAEERAGIAPAGEARKAAAPGIGGGAKLEVSADFEGWGGDRDRPEKRDDGERRDAER